jgi:hypothetical protein
MKNTGIINTYDNNLRGALFRNLDATETNKQPNYRGVTEIDGNKYDISGWVETSSMNSKLKGAKFLSIKLSLQDNMLDEVVTQSQAKEEITF